VKKFIKNIYYSKEEVAVILYYKRSSEDTNSFYTASGWVGAAACRNSVSTHPKKITPISTDRGNHQERLPDLGSPQTVDIILPNTIHGCKKKDL